MQNETKCDYTLPQHFSEDFKRRLWRAVIKESGTIPERNPELGECWIWLRATSGFGYGQIARGDGKLIHAHRAVWILTYGEIPPRFKVLHKCDNPFCVRPTHLFCGTQRDNIVDMCVKGRHFDVHLPGESNGFHKLKEAQIIEIRKLRNDGWSYRKISREYGIAFSHAHRISKKEAWNHIG